VRTPRATLILRWLAALAGAAYVATVVALGPRLVENNHWDSDVSGPLALADRLPGSGPVYIPHYGEWVTFWWLLATRGLPGHEDIWTASGYGLTLLGAALLAWATWSIAGRWAGVTAAATALVVGPFALRSFLSTTGAHVTNPFGAVVLACVLVLLSRTRSWLPAIVGGLIAGSFVASDGLLWFAGIVPFALAAALLARTTRRRDVALRASATLVIAVTTFVATDLVMRALDYRLAQASVGLDSLRDLPHNIIQLVRMIALLGGANYALPGGGYPQEPLRTIVALLTFAAVGATLLAATRAFRAEAPTRAYAFYWAVSVGLLGVALVVTPNASDLGPKSVNYILTFVFAAGAGLGLLAASSLRAQTVVAAGVAIVAAANIAGIIGGRAEVTGVIELQEQAPKILQTLERRGVTRGYAGFWNAGNLSWQTNMRLMVSPVVSCGAKLCPNNFFTIQSWYEPKGGPTFLLVDPRNVDLKAPPFVSDAAATYRFGPLILYVFEDDIAKHILTAPTS
jgi:hypothetical protein